MDLIKRIWLIINKQLENRAISFGIIVFILLILDWFGGMSISIFHFTFIIIIIGIMHILQALNDIHKKLK